MIIDAPEISFARPEDTPRYSVEGNGSLIVFIPGLDGTGELFYKQASALTRSHRVATFRLRDQGQFGYDDLADDVAAIIADQGERKAMIVAESFGGGVALTFALRYPDMVERLVIVNSFPRFRQRARIKLAARLAQVAPFRLVWMARQVANRLGLMAEGVKGEDRRRFFEIVRTVKREGYARRLRLIAELNLEDRLCQIQAPTLFIAGEKDLLIPSVKEARAMARLMPNARVRIVKGAGHACLLGDRVRLAELLAD